MARSILCFGDSNTWGMKPGSPERYDFSSRWPGVCEAALAADWRVVEEGLPGRTTMLEDPIEGPLVSRSGIRYLPPCLASHMPVRVFVLMLGTNDLKRRFGLEAVDIVQGIDQILTYALRVGASADPPMRALLVAPVPIDPVGDGAILFEDGARKSRGLAPGCERLAEKHGCGFIDAGDHCAVSPIDGVHLDEVAHRQLGLAIAAAIGRQSGQG